MADKPKFDPSKSFEVIDTKPKFDPNKPFEPLERQSTLEDRVLEKIVPYAAPVGKALDYLAGATRTGLGAIASDKIGIGDFGNALLAKPLSGSEILKRLGVPEGGSLSDVAPGLFTENGAGISLEKGGPLDITPRGAGGFALETALDPLTYVTGGISGLVKGGGKKIYKSAFKEADDLAKLTNKIPVSDILLNEGVAGTGRSIEKQARNLTERLSDKVNDLVKNLSDGGAKINMETAVSGAREKLLNEVAIDSPEKIAEAAKLLKTKIPEYLKRGDVDLQRANDLKKRFDFKAKDFGPLAQKSDLELAVDKSLQKGIRSEIERAASEIDPKIGQAISDANQANSSLITALGSTTKGPLQKLAEKTGNPIGKLTTALGGAALTGDTRALGAALASGLYDVGNTTAAKTIAGKSIYNFADTLSKVPGSKVIDKPISRRALIELLSRTEEKK